MQIDRGMMRKRVNTFLLFLTLGLITNVLVAVGCDQSRIWIPPIIATDDEDELTKYIHLYTGLVFDLNKIDIYGIYWHEYSLGLEETYLGVALFKTKSFTTDDQTEFEDLRFMDIEVLAKRAGWPLYAFSGEVVSIDGKHDKRYALLYNYDSRYSMSHKIIPYRPMPIGLIVNTIFYAGIWFALIQGPRSARRKLRTIRGRCPLCNYDIHANTDSGCPECGWGRDEK